MKNLLRICYRNARICYQPHGSMPGNPLLAEPLYLTPYIERMGTGTRGAALQARLRDRYQSK